ncbi:MAG TPA: hypothetical protein VMC06_00340 [Opitutaceae bacterium]|nr:hypothetical protein [Opitutaceae bacterium]
MTTNLRERTDHQPPSPVIGAGDPGGGNLEALAQEGAAFLAAGHDIINAALSGDSQAFLAANRQRGGE